MNSYDRSKPTLLRRPVDPGCDPRSEWWTSCPSVSRSWSACSKASSTRLVRIVVYALQPTMRREKTSITKATYTKPRQGATYVKSANHSAFGLSALNRRLTRSSGHSEHVISGRVVLTLRPRTTLRSPSASSGAPPCSAPPHGHPASAGATPS